MSSTAVKVTYDEGSAPSTPAANKVVTYAKSDGLMYSKDDAGVETLMSGGAGGGAIATDVIWDAAGDLVQGTGSNTGAKLTAGTAGMFLKSAGAAAANLWAFPPGYELDYVQITSNVSITATSEATANTCITGSAIAYDGSTVVLITAYTPGLVTDGTAPRDITMWLYDGSSSIGAFAQPKQVGTFALPYTITASRRLTPSNATHTYSIRCSVSAGTGAFSAGAGGTGVFVPAYIRITKV